MNHHQLILSIIFLFNTSFIIAQDWNLVKNDDGIFVYTRKIDGLFIKDVKINTKINATLNELVAALEDFDQQEKWVRNTKESRKIEEVSTSHFFFYTGINFPFPAKDRDTVIEYRRVQEPNSKVIKIDYEAYADKIPVSKDYIRMPALTAYYILTPLSENTIAIEYYIRVDIGGNIPNWIINMAISIGPSDTMKSLKKVLASGMYANVKVAGVEDLYKSR
jgi:hypothetical protein